MINRIKARIIEVLRTSYGSSFNAPYFSEHQLEPLADHLIANNLTIDEWFPASEPPTTDEHVLVTCGKGYKPFVARYDLRWKRWKVSHTLTIRWWRPLPTTRNLPEVPKGDT